MRKIKGIGIIAACALALAGLSGCSSQDNGAQAGAGSEAAVQSESAAEAGSAETSAAENGSEGSKADASAAEAGDDADADMDVEGTVRVGSLKGPTTIGLVNMMSESEAGELPFGAEFTMATTGDELSAKLVSGDLDIALIPANLASVLYNKTEGGISVININTLGVLYGVTGDDSVQSLADLEGKTVYMTGQGTTPEYAVNYILSQNGLKDKVNIEFRNEATEIAALLNEDPTGTAILPQPFATVCTMQNEAVREFLDLNDEWEKCEGSGDSQLVTGVTVVRNEFLEENPELVSAFQIQHEASVLKAEEDPDTTAELIVNYGIIEKAPIAKAALPKCNIACIKGETMHSALSGYLQVLYEADPASVGGELPGDDFYAVIE